MYKKTYYATAPDSMIGVDNQQLRDKYLITGLFSADEVSLFYSHVERMVVGGAMPVKGPLTLPVQDAPASAKGKPSLFGCFIGTTALSDFSSAYIFIVQFLP